MPRFSVSLIWFLYYYYFNCESVDLYYLLITFALIVVTNSDSNRLKEFLHAKARHRQKMMMTSPAYSGVIIYESECWLLLLLLSIYSNQSILKRPSFWLIQYGLGDIKWAKPGTTKDMDSPSVLRTFIEWELAVSLCAWLIWL